MRTDDPNKGVPVKDGKGNILYYETMTIPVSRIKGFQNLQDNSAALLKSVRELVAIHKRHAEKSK